MDALEMRKRLNRLFGGLWSLRNGVKGSWSASSFRYHPTYILRRPMLLVGETEFGGAYVLDPPDAKVCPVYGDSCANCSTRPIVGGGRMIQVDINDDGPWKAFLAAEIPLMEQELESSAFERERAAAAERQKNISKRESDLAAARRAFTNNTAPDGAEG